tara:strand:+ start:4219 stop:4719 length:501 start_codon:yes stop_codon:yes gene_type:complete
MLVKIYLISTLLFLASCNNIKFVYKNDLNSNNPIYKKTSFALSGLEIQSFYGQNLRYFGEYEEELYKLIINIDEEKTKRSVKSNQALSKLDYKLIFKYQLLNNKINCVVHNKQLISRFTYEPRSAGYNFGSDQSLIDLYNQAGGKNLQQFINSLAGVDLGSCINES